MTADPHVIIIGAGPAGSVAAFKLASRGVPVTVLEKDAFPRYKVCGGGLTFRCVAEIPFDISPVTETVIHSIRFSMNFKDTFTRTSAEPLMVCTMREQLDEFLISKAREAGATVHFNEKVTALRLNGSSAEVVTEKQAYQTRLVIGADGASGIAARTAGLKKDIMPGLAWEAELYPGIDFLQKNRDTVFLDWGTFPGGYGWIFPKKDHVSVGVGGPAALSQHMMQYYGRFLDYSGMAEHPGADSIKAWPIPVRIRKGVFHKEPLLLAGDAAGLTDPLTGEGIYYAVRSGKLAADAVLQYLEGKPGALNGYSEAVNDELMKELMEARRIGYLFNTVPGKIHHFVRDSDRAWRAFGKILRGERRYTDVRNGFGHWRSLWGMACKTAGLLEKRKENHFRINGFTAK